MHDYYWEMSYGACDLIGWVETQENGEPVWLTLPHSKSFYYTGQANIFADAKDVAQDAGFDVSPNDCTKLAIVYAGNWYRAGLAPIAQRAYDAYRVPERWTEPVDAEHVDAKFLHIGPHCHEFAHLFGARHAGLPIYQLRQLYLG